ncbi:hypothetical protein HDU85_007453 [Gaertneriomyces sp. JEL0708]|nr:hypothetical protein HDU85_007453 [Gaertneriomyces sp. JEL0708]
MDLIRSKKTGRKTSTSNMMGNRYAFVDAGQTVSPAVAMPSYEYPQWNQPTSSHSYAYPSSSYMAQRPWEPSPYIRHVPYTIPSQQAFHMNYSQPPLKDSMPDVRQHPLPGYHTIDHEITHSRRPKPPYGRENRTQDRSRALKRTSSPSDASQSHEWRSLSSSEQRTENPGLYGRQPAAKASGKVYDFSASSLGQFPSGRNKSEIETSSGLNSILDEQNALSNERSGNTHGSATLTADCNAVIDLTEDDDDNLVTSISQSQVSYAPSVTEAIEVIRKRLSGDNAPDMPQAKKLNNKEQPMSSISTGAPSSRRLSPSRDTTSSLAGDDKQLLPSADIVNVSRSGSSSAAASPTLTPTPNSRADASEKPAHPEARFADASKVPVAGRIPTSNGVAINPKFFRVGSGGRPELTTPHRKILAKAAGVKKMNGSTGARPSIPMKRGSSGGNAPRFSTNSPKPTTTSTLGKPPPIPPAHISFEWPKSQQIEEKGCTKMVVFADAWVSPVGGKIYFLGICCSCECSLHFVSALLSYHV